MLLCVLKCALEDQSCVKLCDQGVFYSCESSRENVLVWGEETALSEVLENVTENDTFPVLDILVNEGHRRIVSNVLPRVFDICALHISYLRLRSWRRAILRYESSGHGLCGIRYSTNVDKPNRTGKRTIEERS